MDDVSLIDRALIVLILVNLAAFALFWFDKTQARAGEWRVPERVLLSACLLGGFGAWLGQQVLRHKTRKEPFRTLMAGALILHGLLLVVVFWRLLA